MDLNTGVPSDFAFTFGVPFTQEVLLKPDYVSVS